MDTSTVQCGQWKQVHNAHAGTCQAEKDTGVNVHLLIYRVHRRDCNENGDSRSTVQMSDRCDQRCNYSDRDHIVAGFFNQPAYDNIKESSVCQNTKINY